MWIAIGPLYREVLPETSISRKPSGERRIARRNLAGSRRPCQQASTKAAAATRGSGGGRTAATVELARQRPSRAATPEAMRSIFLLATRVIGWGSRRAIDQCAGGSK